MKKIFTLFTAMCFVICSSTMLATDITSHFSANQTLTLAGSPYIIKGNININNGVTITIEDGVEIRFDSGRYLYVLGTLNATGTTFTANSNSPTAGFWDGIYIGSQGNSFISNVSLDNCTIEYARNVYVRKGNLVMKDNCVIRKISGYGLDLYTDGSVTMENTTITECSYPIYFRNTYAGGLAVGDNVDLTGNTNDYIYFDAAQVNASLTLSNVGIPYYYNSELRVTATGELTIEAGVKMEATNGAYINVFGILKANGTKDEPIQFYKYPSQSYWQGINFQTHAFDADNLLTYCEIKDVLYNDINRSALDLISSSPTIDHCTFSNNIYNFYARGSSNPEVINCTFEPSTQITAAAYNINIDLNANPNFTSNTVTFNEKEAQAIGIVTSTVTVKEAQLPQRSFEDIDNITYLLRGQVTVHDTASLEIEAGVVIKCQNASDYIYGNGVINGIGTEDEPIIFTFREDDDYGNPADTYQNGATTVAHSASGRLMLYSTATSRLEHWKILYAGYGSTRYALYMRQGNVLTKSDVINSYRGVYFQDNVQIIDNNFENIDYFPVARHFNPGTPSLVNNTLDNVGNSGIYVYGFVEATYSIGGLNFAGNENVAYIVDTNLDIPEAANVTINPGTVFKFSGGSLRVRGGLNATGTKNNKIIFTSIHDDSASGDTNNNGTASSPSSGNWTGFGFYASSNDAINALKNCEIRYSGQGYDVVNKWAGSIRMNDCKVVIDSSLVNFSNSNALAIYGSSNPIITHNEFFNLGQEPVHMDMFANPTFSGNTVANVPNNGISLRGQTVSGTVPVRSFNGNDTITYVMREHMTVADELTIPAGLTFKSDRDVRWYINGKVNVNGTANNKVVFTSFQDDAYGQPKDLQGNGSTGITNNGAFFIFSDQADDNSVINYASFRHCRSIAIQCNNASPTITNCRFENFANAGLSITGTSAPTLNNSLFNNISYPYQTSLVSELGSASGNKIEGSTARVIKVRNETLSQDVTLDKRNFAGITNIAYLFDKYTVGNSSILTINAGVVSKFLAGGYINVKKGLIVKGGDSPETAVVFTADRDDFYGGDTYNDGDASLPNDYYWQGIHFAGEAIDASCIITNAVFKHGSYYVSNNAHSSNRGAITVQDASPTITDCLFEHNFRAIIAKGESNPVITGCDFVGTSATYSYGVWKDSGESIIDAKNCWWNHNTGPKHASNPDGLGERVSDKVNYSPFSTQLAKPALGDVSLNGEIKPYDASLVLQHAAQGDVLNTKQQGVADVSGNGTVSSFDASLILQFSIGLITMFDQAGTKSGSLLDVDVLSDKSFIHPDTKQFEVPIKLSTTEKVTALDIKFTSNSDHIKLVDSQTANFPSNVGIARGYNTSTGDITFSMASAYDLNLNNHEIRLIFELQEGVLNESSIGLTNIMANEQVINEQLEITVNSSTATGVKLPAALSAFQIYSVDQLCHIDLNLSEPQSNIQVTFTDLSGKTTNKLNINQPIAGIHNIISSVVQSGKSASPGIYLITVNGDNFSITRKVIVR